jgi:Tfp pilus assembly protein PilF
MRKKMLMQRAGIFVVGLLANSLLDVSPGHSETSTGTGFAVSQNGDVVTNEHVISDCTISETGTLKAHQGGRDYIGTVRASDKNVDLAIVRLRPIVAESQARLSEIAVLRQSPPLRPGEHAIAYGFPLSGALASDGNLTIGNVSALRGLGDDPKYIQITTPIQPGNSGGPLLDGSGNVIGVTAAKLDAITIMRAIGDVPQNINFAIELGTLKRFLRDHGVSVQEASSKEELAPADIGDRARLFTYLIECQTPSTLSPQAQTTLTPQSPSYRDAPVPLSSAPPEPIPLNASKLKWSDLRRPYPSISPEIFAMNVSNVGTDRVTEITIGFFRQEKPCSWNFADYDGLKPFGVNLPPGDAVTLTGAFSAQAKAFCIVKALGPPEGRAACANGIIPADVAIAACTRRIESGKVQGLAVAATHVSRGAQWARKRDFDRAISDFDEAIRLGRKDVIVFVARGDAFNSKGEYKRAILDFNQAIALDPKYALAYASRSYSYGSMGEYDHAIADGTEAIRLGARHPSAYLSRGFSYVKKHEYDHAIADLNETIRLDPSNVAAFYDRAQAYYDEGDYDQAIADATEAIRFAPTSSLRGDYARASLLVRGYAYFRRSEYDRAIADFSEIIRLDPQNASALHWRGVAERVRNSLQ